MITSNLKLTDLPSVYRISRIAPLQIWEAIMKAEHEKLNSNNRYSLFGHQEVPQWLSSCKSLCHCHKPWINNTSIHLPALVEWVCQRQQQWGSSGTEKWSASRLWTPPERVDNIQLGWAKVAKMRNNLHKWDYYRMFSVPVALTCRLLYISLQTVPKWGMLWCGSEGYVGYCLMMNLKIVKCYDDDDRILGSAG